MYCGLMKNPPQTKAEIDSATSMNKTWLNLKLGCLTSSDREVLFLLSHNKLPIKERLFRIGQTIDPYCEFCLNSFGAVVCDTDHFFCTCSNIASFWIRIRALSLALLGIQNASNSELLKLNLNLKKCPGVAWIIGTYVSNVWNSNEGRMMCKEEFFGFLRFKFKMLNLGTEDQNEKVDAFLR